VKCAVGISFFLGVVDAEIALARPSAQRRGSACCAGRPRDAERSRGGPAGVSSVPRGTCTRCGPATHAPRRRRRQRTGANARRGSRALAPAAAPRAPLSRAAQRRRGARLHTRSAAAALQRLRERVRTNT
jgi:hypothetical protein